jgi:hypothetical protein
MNRAPSFFAHLLWHVFAWAAALGGIYLSLAHFNHWWPVAVTLGPVLAIEAVFLVAWIRGSPSRGFHVPRASPERAP